MEADTAGDGDVSIYPACDRRRKYIVDNNIGHLLDSAMEEIGIIGFLLPVISGRYRARDKQKQYKTTSLHKALALLLVVVVKLRTLSAVISNLDKSRN